MANVTTFTSPTTSYPAPDFGLIAQSTKDISRLAIFQSDKMEAIREKAKRVSSYALDLQTTLGDELVPLSTNLQSLDFGDLFEQLAEIDEQLATGKLSSEDRTAVKDARGELEGVFGSEIRETLAKLRAAANKVQGKSVEIGAVVLAERITETLQRHLDRQPKLAEEIADKRAAWKTIDDDRKKIIAAQDVFRERNVLDITKDALPKDLDKLDLKKPEIELIRLGIEVLTKMLGEISAGFKYSDLVDQRLVLDGKIEKLSKEIDELLAEQRENDALVGDLTAAMTIASKRDKLVREVKKLPVALSGFGDQLEKLGGPAVTEASVSKLLGTIRSYLDNCLDARNKVIIL